MKLLVDTSVWSLALRRKDPGALVPEERKLKAELTQAIQDGRVAIIGLIRQELLSGIREPAQFEKLKAALDPFVDEPIATSDHEYAARVYNECKAAGVEVGTVDILFCAIAARRGWEVLSSDAALKRCLDIARKFQPKHGVEEAGPRRPMRRHK